MALLKIKCPECNAGLKSPTGFKVGQTVPCPKCETYFTVEEPEEEEDEAPKKAATTKGKPATAKKPVKAAVADDEDEDEEDEEEVAPKKKKKKKKRDDDDEEGSYKNSPLRYVILGVLVLIMLVLLYFLIEKHRDKPQEAEASNTTNTNTNNAPNAQPAVPGRGPGVPGPQQPRPQPKKGGGGTGALPVGDFLGGAAPAGAEAQALKQKYQTLLTGTWTADLGDGFTEELTYNADGTYSAKLTGPTPATAAGKYNVVQMVGTKALRLRIETPVAKTIVVSFAGDELEHPSLRPGVTGTYRKK